MNGEYQLVTINTSVNRDTSSKGFTMNGHGDKSYIELNGENEDFPLPENRFAPGGNNGIGKNKMRSYSKWSPTEQGATLVWRDVCVYAKQQGTEQRIKRIINNVSGAVTPGTLVALMGSSGAGKSTLMSSLAYRNPSGTIVQGDILVNGKPIGPFMYRLSGFVHQDDLFIGTLTVKEHLTFMAHLKCDSRMTKFERRRLINDLLERTGLKKCARTKIGEDGEGKMLSGGEKKRLAFASELLTQPTMLFCDEPTTGLDSYSAQQLVATLQQLANRGTAIICTIHQPSSQLFAMFDQVMFLTEGRVAFMGAPDNAIEFFSQQGYTCPKTYNPADFLIGVLAPAPGCEKASLRIANRICDLFAVSEAAQQRDMLINLEMHIGEEADLQTKYESVKYRKPYWITTVFWLMYRALLTVVRDPTVQYLRIIQKIAIAIMAGLCFTGTVNLSQLGVQAVQGALFIFISENTFSPMYAVLSLFPQMFPLFLRETKSGLYNTAQYYIATVIAMLPGLVFEPFIFVVIAYWLAQLRNTIFAFSMTALASILVMNVSTACGCFFSAAFNSVPQAMAYLVPFDYILMITSGVFVQLSTLPNYLSWMPYISWMKYANEAMSIVQWQGVTNLTCPITEDNLPCLQDGADVLAKYSFSDDNLARDIWALVILYLLFHTLGYIFLWRKTRRT
uniref:CSON003410 protein n=1 Tax=Culicoides sonorensis TaxID=179676 RepID=A0A336L180_CULSO